MNVNKGIFFFSLTLLVSCATVSFASDENHVIAESAMIEQLEEKSQKVQDIFVEIEEQHEARVEKETYTFDLPLNVRQDIAGFMEYIRQELIEYQNENPEESKKGIEMFEQLRAKAEYDRFAQLANEAVCYGAPIAQGINSTIEPVIAIPALMHLVAPVAVFQIKTLVMNIEKKHNPKITERELVKKGIAKSKETSNILHDFADVVTGLYFDCKEEDESKESLCGKAAFMMGSLALRDIGTKLADMPNEQINQEQQN